jgi:ATP-dependent helicase/nuclease subunit B
MAESREIIRSASAHARLRRALDWLALQAPGAEVLVLANAREAADDLVRSLAATRAALAGIHRLTLDRLAGLLAAAAMAERGLAPAAGLAHQALAARTVFRLATDGRLAHFAPVIDRPGFAQALARTIAELRLDAVTPADLAGEGASGAALGAMLEQFETELADANLIDRAGMLAMAAAAAARESETERLVGIPILLLDLSVTSRCERELVATLCARSPRALATVPAGDARGAAMLAAAMGVEPVDLSPDSAPGAGASSLARLQTHLFARTAPAPHEVDETVTVTSAPGEMHECVEVARRIVAEARRGVRFDRIAVLVHDPERYVPYLHEALARARIPAWFARGARRPRPEGRAMLALLACAAENLSARRYAEYLSLAQVPDENPPAGPPAPQARDELIPSALSADLEPGFADYDEMAAALPGSDGARTPWRWEKLLVEAAVIGSAERWRRRLEGLGAEFARQRLELEEDDARVAQTDRRIRNLEHLRATALAQIAMLAALPKEASWGEWLGHLRALAIAAIRDSEPVLAVLGDLEPMAPVGPVGLDEVRMVLARRLSTLETVRGARGYGMVYVGSPARARGMSFEVVIVPGLAERVFPRKFTEDPLLPDAMRARVAPEMPRSEERVEAERMALRIAAGAARERVMFSYPRVDLDQGRPRVPSFYALEVLRAAEGRLPGFDELARRAACEQAARLGWPAPGDAQLAIDEAEFDLAILDRLVDSDPETTRGAAHYLLGANPNLGRALRSRARRWLKRWTPADGLVDPAPQALAALGRHQLAARAYSPTALQHYAACPYRFLLQAIHRLEPREEPEAIEAIDPLTRGGLFHEVQFEVLSALRSRALLPVTTDNLGAAHEILEPLLDAVAERWREELAPAIERVWQDGIEGIRADLREWLRRSATESGGWVPDRFELAFGLPGRAQTDPASSPDAIVVAQRLRLRGSIDLVESGAGGALRVTDHKTGKVRAENDFVIGGGKILQPVLYALAAEQILEHPVGAGRLYYCTAAGGYEERFTPIDRAARAAAESFAQTLDDALGSGFLPAAPAEGECRWCDYRRVCGPYEERRSAIKPAARIAALRKLREMR